MPTNHYQPKNLQQKKQAIIYPLPNNMGRRNPGNWAFIDVQNLWKGTREKGWKIHWKSFRHFLAVELNVTEAIGFIGFLEGNEHIYRELESAGFRLIGREVKRFKDGSTDGGNLDAFLSAALMDHKYEYNRAIVVADDSDYSYAISSLYRQDKLRLIISSHTIEQTSRDIKRIVRQDLILSIHNIQEQIGQKRIA